MPRNDFQVHDGLLAVQQTSEGDLLRLSLQGEMDLANAETADTVIREALASARAVVIDLTKLEFIDSTGISMLLEAQAASRRDSNRLGFRGVRAEVARTLKLTGVDEQLRFVD